MNKLLQRLGSVFMTGGTVLVGTSVLVKSCLFDVDPGHRAIVFNAISGVKDYVYEEGSHFKVPILHKPIHYDVRARPRSITEITGSKDLQNVNITLRILFRPKVEVIPRIFTNLGIDYDERVLPSITKEVLKAIVAQYDASELITQRDTVSQRVEQELKSRAESFGVILDDISLTHLTFGREFTQAVEAKQVAQQDAERARYLVEKAEFVKQAAIIQAEGEAKAAELISSALQSSGEGMIELRRIEAAEDIAGKLSKSKNVTFLPDSQQMLLGVK